MTDTSGFSASDPTEITITAQAKKPVPPAPVYPVAYPRCFVDIYPFEGGSYMLPYASLLTCEVSKVINDAVPGTFTITIAPGGPNGVNIPPSWTEVLTPQSTVVIGMSRGSYAAVTMVGVITQVSEESDWSSGESVDGSVTISGMDFGYYFNLSSMYSVWFLGATGIQNGSAAAAAGTASAADPILGQHLTQGTPDQMAQAWLELPMLGTKGVMSKSYVQYRGSKVLLNDALSSWFEHYDVQNLFAAYLMADQETWASKFKQILPFPWYEFNVITAPPNFYPAASGGTQFYSQGLGQSITAAPTVVGRINPTPTLTATASGTNPTFNGLDDTRWKALNLFQLDTAAIDTVIGFDNSAVLNFFALNPTSMLAAMGQSNSQTSPYIFAFASAGNLASMERYGFRPAVGDTNWLADPTFQIGATGDANNDQLLADLMSRFAATYGPQGDMARGSVRTMLRPDILPGCRLRFQPFKNGENWDFYIDSVTHRHIFGKRSGTWLTLSRGLPSSVYADDSDTGLLFNVHVGNIKRENGQFSTGLPPGSDSFLQAIPPGNQQQYFAKLAKVYQTPQATSVTQ